MMASNQSSPGYVDRSPADIDAIGSAIVGLDRDVRDLERRWGVGRLIVLADDLLRERFLRQRRKLDEAIWSTASARDVLAHIEATRRGWQALERAAVAAGHAPKPPEVWEVRLPDGTVAALVHDRGDASIVAADGRGVAVYTLEEIGKLLARFPQLVTAKAAFPGATVTDIRTREPVDWARGDDIPW